MAQSWVPPPLFNSLPFPTVLWARVVLMGLPLDKDRVDDFDPIFQYSSTGGASDWYTAGTSSEFDNTVHSTRKAGATVTISFSGAFINVYGTIPAYRSDFVSPITSSYTIDGGTPKPFAANLFSGSPVEYQQQFFASGSLQNGPHTLVIESTTAEGAFYLDYVSFTDS
ncbi:hypothetical protein C8J56DRAFT_1111701, partial [Mycena floridula]